MINLSYRADSEVRTRLKDVWDRFHKRQADEFQRALSIVSIGGEAATADAFHIIDARADTQCLSGSVEAERYLIPEWEPRAFKRLPEAPQVDLETYLQCVDEFFFQKLELDPDADPADYQEMIRDWVVYVGIDKSFLSKGVKRPGYCNASLAKLGQEFDLSKNQVISLARRIDRLLFCKGQLRERHDLITRMMVEALNDFRRYLQLAT